MKKQNNNKPIRVALYIRRAEKPRDVDGVLQLSYDQQEKLCKKFCLRNNMTYYDHHRFYDTITVDTNPEKRSGFQALLCAAQNREFDVVVVYDLRTIARNVWYICTALDALAVLGIDFCCSTEYTYIKKTPGKPMYAALTLAVRELGAQSAERQRLEQIKNNDRDN